MRSVFRWKNRCIDFTTMRATIFDFMFVPNTEANFLILGIRKLQIELLLKTFLPKIEYGVVPSPVGSKTRTYHGRVWAGRRTGDGWAGRGGAGRDADWSDR